MGLQTMAKRITGTEMAEATGQAGDHFVCQQADPASMDDRACIDDALVTPANVSIQKANDGTVCREEYSRTAAEDECGKWPDRHVKPAGTNGTLQVQDLERARIAVDNNGQVPKTCTSAR